MAYYWMTKELLNICDKMVVVQEGGYNTDYLGQHASGVVKALLKITPESPTLADLDAGITSVDDISADKAKEWAKQDVKNTASHLEGYWKCMK